MPSGPMRHYSIMKTSNMNVFKYFKNLIQLKTQESFDLGVDELAVQLDRMTVESPRDAAHGDLAANTALLLAKPLAQPPRAVAEKLAAALRKESEIAAVEIAGPGFINLTIADEFWQQRIPEILSAGRHYGDHGKRDGEKVNVEYVSANPTGPMHIGHVRGAVYGDALASLLAKAGFDVTREYYINDAGSQIDTLARSVHLRYREALGEGIGEIPDGLYPGDYLVPLGRELAETHGGKWVGAPEEEWLEPIRIAAADAMMNLIKKDLASLGIAQDVFFSERELQASGRVGEMIEVLKNAGHVYEGVLEPPKGKKPDDWEPRAQTLFRATDFGDDVDRALLKSDGSYTYFAADIAYHYDKYKRGFLKMIDVFGADHGGYVKRMKAAVTALSGGRADVDIRQCQIVRLFRDGEPIKMSKRSGSFITLRELLDEVGRDVVRFYMLTRKNDAPLDFDYAKVLEQSRDNPVFYVQYAHARVHSVFRKAAEAFPGMDFSDAALEKADFSLLRHDAELALIKRLTEWPRSVEAAAEAYEPHRIAFYLYDLAAEFHTLWNKGNEDRGLRFIVEDDAALTSAHLALIRAVAIVIASGLGILGVEPVKEMH